MLLLCAAAAACGAVSSVDFLLIIVWYGPSKYGDTFCPPLSRIAASAASSKSCAHTISSGSGAGSRGNNGRAVVAAGAAADS